MARPVVRETFIANLHTRMLHFWAAGDVEPTVALKYDSSFLVAKGKVKIIINDTINEFTAPHIVYRKANTVCNIEAVTDNTVVYQVNVLRDDNGLILEPDMVPDGSDSLRDLAKKLKA